MHCTGDWQRTLQLSKYWFASVIVVVDEGSGKVPAVQVHQKITMDVTNHDMVQPSLRHCRSKPSFEPAKSAEGTLGGT